MQEPPQNWMKTLEYYNTLVTDLQAEQQELQKKLDDLQQNPPSEDAGIMDSSDGSDAVDESSDTDSSESGSKAEVPSADQNTVDLPDSTENATTQIKEDPKEDSSEPADSSKPAEDKNTDADSSDSSSEEKTEASTGKMVAVAYTVVTSPTTPSDDSGDSGSSSVPVTPMTPADAEYSRIE